MHVFYVFESKITFLTVTMLVESLEWAFIFSVTDIEHIHFSVGHT